LATTPQFFWPYQSLTDSPNGAMLGQDLALAAEATVAGINTRLTTVESRLPPLQTWPPTLTALTVGNGTQTAIWAPLGDLAWYRYRLIFGTSTVMGSGPKITLPVLPNPAYHTSDEEIGHVTMLDAGIALYTGGAVNLADGLGTVEARIDLTSATYASLVAISATVPMTWGAGDTLKIEGIYVR
jgi:hypothetical protein